MSNEALGTTNSPVYFPVYIDLNPPNTFYQLSAPENMTFAASGLMEEYCRMSVVSSLRFRQTAELIDRINFSPEHRDVNNRNHERTDGYSPRQRE